MQWTQTIILTMTLVPVLHLVKTLGDVTTQASRFARLWEEEYQVRLCGALGATDANLADAARLLGEGRVNREADELVGLAEQLTSTLRAHYPEAALANDSGVCRGSLLGAVAVVERQVNPDLPENVPNWVVRLRPEAP